MSPLRIEEVVAVLEGLAPPRFAAAWDNTGLLLEGDRPVRSVLVTIDLTEDVCQEALDGGVDLVVAYHPPIFKGLKRLTRATPITRSLLRLARQGVHLYSPHTALDAVPGGMNDWLLEPFEVRESAPIEPDRLEPSAGVGRIAVIAPCTDWIARIKSHLGLAHVRVAGVRSEVGSIAVCPGSGGSVFGRLGQVDLLLTGEMSHHDVLAWVARGTAVVLTEHTHTERGYLPRLAQRLSASGLEVAVSQVDRDPLTVA